MVEESASPRQVGPIKLGNRQDGKQVRFAVQTRIDQEGHQHTMIQALTTTLVIQALMIWKGPFTSTLQGWLVAVVSTSTNQRTASTKRTRSDAIVVAADIAQLQLLTLLPHHHHLLRQAALHPRPAVVAVRVKPESLKP